MITIAIASTLLNIGSVTGVVIDGNRAVGEAVVWLEGGKRPQPITATMDQRGKRFIPHILVVPVGSTVNFPNSDDIFHNVFAEYNASKFDLGMYPKGQKKVRTFDRPGVVALLCNIHAEMSAYIYIVDSGYYTKSDAKGQFTLSGIPSGSYTLKAWHESGKRSSEAVTVSSTGANLTIKIKR